MKCRECHGTGTVHIDIPAACSKVFDLACWVCSGTALKGMNKDQVKWYRTQYKSLDALKSKSLRAGEVSDPLAYGTVKNQINKACSKLGIALLPVARQKATVYGVTDAFLTMKAEMKEYERRLLLIPVVIAGQTVAKVAA